MKANRCVVFFYVAFGLAIITLGQAVGQRSSSLPTLTRKEERSEIVKWDEHGPEPIWSGRSMLGLALNYTATPIIWSLDRDGRREEVQFSIPGAGYIIIWSLAGNANGTIALCGEAISNNNQLAGFFGLIPPDRSKKVAYQLGSYVPYTIAIARDGLIWTVGRIGGTSSGTFNVLKRFDPNGGQLSSLETKVTKGGLPSASGGPLRSSKDRVAWLTDGSEYLEFSFDGKEIMRVDGPPWPAGNDPWRPGTVFAPPFVTMSIDDTNRVIVYLRNRPPSNFWTLDRKNRSWKPIVLEGGQLASWAHVFGFDGPELVTNDWKADRGESIVRFMFSGVN